MGHKTRSVPPAGKKQAYQYLFEVQLHYFLTIMDSDCTMGQGGPYKRST